MKIKIIFFLILFLLNSLVFGYESQRSKSELISAYIYLLSKNTSWPNEDDVKIFNIVIMEDGFNIYNTFKDMSSNLHLKNKDIKLHHYSCQDDIYLKDVQVIFVSDSFKNDVEEIYKKIGLNSTLLISENSENLKYTMINIYEDKKYRLNIELNLNNIQTHGLDINKKIILSSASKIGIGKLYHSSIDAMKRQEEKFKKYQQLNEKYRKKIDILNKDISDKIKKYNKMIKDIGQKELIISKKEKLLKNKEESIKVKKKKIQKLQDNLKKLKIELSEHKYTLDEKIKNIQKQKKILQKYLKVLDDKLLEIKKLDEKIKNQEKTIKINNTIQKEQKAEIEQQKTSLYLMGIIAVMLLLFVIYFYKNKLKYQKINEKLQIARNEAINANKSKSIFISKMSHELRTPLNAILGFSELLMQNDNISNDDKKSLKVINNSGVFLLKLINDILDISSIESNKIVLQDNIINMKNILDDVKVLVQNSVDIKGLKLNINYIDNNIKCIKIDDKLVKQILLNLLTNSIKYSNKGIISLDIKLEQKQNKLYIKISDNGIGISEEDLKYIFEPFKQVGDTSSSQGSGLGLAIVKQFIGIMNGDISVESSLGVGTSFIIHIPYRKCTKKEMVLNSNHKEQKKIVGVSEDTVPIKIMIVEDKENNILLLTKILSILKFEIKVVKDGETAIEEFKEFRPNLIFMDKRMPKMDGITATKIIRDLDETNDVKVVMLSANAFAKISSNELVDAFIFKPYKAKDIYAIISKYFSVTYIYKDTVNKEDNNKGFSFLRFKKHLEMLEVKLLNELFDSAVLLNKEDMVGIMNKIEKQDVELYKMLNYLVDKISFMEILNSIDEVRS